MKAKKIGPVTKLARNKTVQQHPHQMVDTRWYAWKVPSILDHKGNLLERFPSELLRITYSRILMSSISLDPVLIGDESDLVREGQFAHC